MNKIKLTTDILLKLSLKALKTTEAKWKQKVFNQIGLASAVYIRTDRKTFKKINPQTNEPLYRDEMIWETKHHFIKTTIHGNIIDIEQKPKSIIKPTIIHKKKRVINEKN